MASSAAAAATVDEPEDRDDALLTPLEVAWRLKCSTSWVYRQVRDRVWPSVQTDRGVRIPATVIDEVLAEREAGPTRDQVFADFAARFIREGQKKGILPEGDLTPAQLARIARHVRSVRID